MLAASTSTSTTEIQYLHVDHMTNVKVQIRVESEERVREMVRRVRRGEGEARIG